MALTEELMAEEEVIKPSSPTPHHLRTIQLSAVDHSSPPAYVAAIFFYDSISSEMISQRLRNSLSQTLTRFFPLAGRIEGVSIDCNDKGVVFTEGQADLLLSDVLTSSDPPLEQFLPTFRGSAASWPLLQVKLTFFRSRGVAIAVYVSHKICDAASVLTFVHGWAATTKGCPDSVIPEFAGDKIYPPAHHSLGSPSASGFRGFRATCITKRFVFYPSKITELKNRAASQSVPNPTRVEAVASLIWRHAAKVSCTSSTTSAMLLPVDLRVRIPSTLLPNNAIGNLQTSLLVKEGPRESEMGMREAVTKFRKAKEELDEMIRENLGSHRTTTTTLGEKLMNVTASFFAEVRHGVDVYPITSWCRKPFYEVDFGWGKPSWVAPGFHLLYKDLVCVVLMDTKDGEGIEAWVGLPEHDMSKFETDPEILVYASLNPCVTASESHADPT